MIGGDQFSETKIVLKPMDVIQVLECIHPGEGAIVSFCRKTGAKWEDLGSVPVSNLRERFSILRDFMDSDLYFGINSTFAQRYGKQSETTGFPKYSRKAIWLRFINAVAVDIDAAHKGGPFSFETLFAQFAQESTERGLPRPNLVCSSGRGMWALWLLHDAYRLDERPQAYPKTQRLAERVNRRIVETFEHLGADRKAIDCARVMRVPGSLNATVGRRVEFFCVTDHTHSLYELALAFGVRAIKTDLHPDNQDAPKNENRVRAGLQRWRIPLQGFRSLWKLRGSFKKDTRSWGVFYFAVLLRKVRTPELEILTECMRLGQSCIPPLAPRDVQRKFESSKAVTRRIRNDTLARDLKITPEEMASLPNWFRPKPARKTWEQRKEATTVRIEQRRALLLAVLDSSKIFSVRKLAKLLEEQHGVKVSHQTISEDLRAIARYPECAAEEVSPGLTPTKYSGAKRPRGTEKDHSTHVFEGKSDTHPVKPQLLDKNFLSQCSSKRDLTTRVGMARSALRAPIGLNSNPPVLLNTSKRDLTPDQSDPGQCTSEWSAPANASLAPILRIAGNTNFNTKAIRTKVRVAEPRQPDRQRAKSSARAAEKGSEWFDPSFRHECS